MSRGGAAAAARCSAAEFCNVLTTTPWRHTRGRAILAVVFTVGALVSKSSVARGSAVRRSVRCIAAILLLMIAVTDGFAQPRRSLEPNSASSENVRTIMRHIVLPNATVLFAFSDARRWRATDLTAAHHVVLTARERRHLQRVRKAATALLAATARLEQPSRCSSGIAAPVRAASWQAGLSRVRDAIHDTAQAVDADDIGAVAETMTAVKSACATCHDAYLDEPIRCRA